MRRAIHPIAVIIIMLSLISCERKDLMEPHTHFNTTIEVEIGNNTGISVQPKSFNYMLISNDNGSVISGQTSGQSQSLTVAPGRYKMLLYTSDFNELDAVLYRGMEDFATAEAYTRQTKSTGSIPRYYITDPDPLFSKVLTDIEIKEATANGEKQIISAQLDQRSFFYYLTIEVEGIEHLRSARMEISGMYTTVFLSDGHHREDEEGVQSIEMQLRENSIYGEFISFGPHKNKDIKNKIILYFANGKNTVIELDDISDRIKPLISGGEIKVDQRFIIHEGDGGTGFNPGVDGWEDIDVPIPL